MKNQDLKREQTFCVKCGNAINKGDKFCGNCGEEIDNNSDLVEEKEENQESSDTNMDRGIEEKTKKIKIIWLITLLITPFFSVGFPVKLTLFLNVEYLLNYFSTLVMFGVAQLLLGMFLSRSYFNNKSKSPEYYETSYRIALILNAFLILVSFFS